MSDTAWMDNVEVRCRCGQVGTVTGVEGDPENPDNVWVSHLVGIAMQTHIHRSRQIPALIAQLKKRADDDAADAAENAAEDAANDAAREAESLRRLGASG